MDFPRNWHKANTEACIIIITHQHYIRRLLFKNPSIYNKSHRGLFQLDVYASHLYLGVVRINFVDVHPLNQHMENKFLLVRSKLFAWFFIYFFKLFHLQNLLMKNFNQDFYIFDLFSLLFRLPIQIWFICLQYKLDEVENFHSFETIPEYVYYYIIMHSWIIKLFYNLYKFYL